MKSRITTLLLLVALVVCLPATVTVAGGFSGGIHEWAAVPANVVTAQNTLTVLKAFQDDETLYIYLEGQELTSRPPTIYLDTGSTPFGYILPHWGKDNLIDFKISDHVLYYYDGNGFSEDWIEVGRPVITANPHNLEIQVNLQDLKVTVPRTIKAAAFISADSLLPESGDPMLMVTPNSRPEEQSTFVVHSATGTTRLYGSIVDDTLHIAVHGKMGDWNDILINTDNNGITGHQSWIWPEMGADYLLEDGFLFKSTGPGWEWQQLAEIAYSSTGEGLDRTIEMALPLALLEREPDEPLRIGFTGGDVYLPAQGKTPISISPTHGDGLATDWSAVASEATASDVVYTLQAIRDQTKLYTFVSGQGLSARNTYYISTGGSTPGYSDPAWPDSQIHYRVKDGLLARFYGMVNGQPQWEPISVVHTDIFPEGVIMSVDLAFLEDYDPAGLQISYMNEARLYLPKQGETMMAITNGIYQPRDENAFYPQEIYDVLNNPFMGWVPWATSGAARQPHRLVYAGISWRELEPVKGQFAWDAIEDKYLFDYWTEKGVKFILRIVLDTPTSGQATLDIPDWLYELTGQAGTWYNTSEIGNGFSPDYNNPIFIEEHARMVSELGKRYNNDPRIAFIQLGSLGHWGEWHTWPSGSGVFPEIAVSDLYVQHYLDAFPDKMIGMRRPFKIARDNRLGLFNDMFGDKRSTDEWIGWYENGRGSELEPAMPDFWKYAYSGGEFANGMALMHLTDEKIADTIRQARESHTSWLGPCSPADAAFGGPQQANLDALLKTLGYRFVIKSITHKGEGQLGEEYSIHMNLENKGVAPFYFPWTLELGLADTNGNIVTRAKTTADIRTWLPGPTAEDVVLHIPSSLTPGEYTLVVAIVDPETDEPGVDLAIAGRRPDGWYELNTITVK